MKFEIPIMKTKIEFRILKHEQFHKNIVYFGIRVLRFFGFSFGFKIPIKKY